MDHEAFGANIENDILNMLDDEPFEPSGSLKIDTKEDDSEKCFEKKDVSFEEHEGEGSTKSSQNGNSPRDTRDLPSNSPIST